MKIIEFLQPGIEQHDSLNPLLWQDQKLLPEVKQKLIDIARHFVNFVDIEFPVIDVVVTGGQTGKFYTKQSDLDLHIITDFNRIECDKEIEELFDTKKMLYKKRYDITIKGIEVELYVEDLSRPAVGGSYSVLKNAWLKPSTEPSNDIDTAAIDKQSKKLASIIQKTIAQQDLELLDKLKDNISQYRRSGLAKQGEYGVANLVFKTLRNSGHIEKLRTAIKDLESKRLSLK